MATPPPQPPHRASGDGRKTTPPTSSIVTRNGARKAKIQTRAMSAGAKPSASLLAAKKKAQQKKKQNVDTVLKDHYQVAMDSKTKIKGPTGFVTEPRMNEHRCLWDDNYPECPERLISVIERCKELDLISQCKEYSSREATKEEIFTLHSPSVYDLMQTTYMNMDLKYLEEVSSRYDAVYIHFKSQELALLAAGSTIDMVDRIITGEVQNGAAFVRPPGHHAMRAEPCGYCFYNNVALAARHALDKGINRILIVDWDVHHGQATQQMFYEDPRVVYFSIHRYEHGSFWPSLRQSDFNYTGSGAGAGRNVNVPLNRTGMGDADYLAIWHQLLLPVTAEFAPQLVIVSAGYDSALGDEKGEMLVTPACYAHLLNMLVALCSRVCVVLEGGYCLRSLAEGAALTLRALLGHPPPPLPATAAPSHSIRETILNVIYAHRKFWKCFHYQDSYSIDTTIPNVCDREKQKHTVTLRWEGDETRPERFATRDCYPVQDNETKRKILEKLNHLRAVTDLSLAQYPVCYIYDQAMLKHKNICEPGHVECPERIMRIHERHRDYGLLDRVHILEARAATDEEILRAHSEKYLNRLKGLAKTKLRDLNSQKDEYDSVYFHPESFDSAAMAAGCAIQMVDAVLNKTAGSGVCVIRPPGHHADEDCPSGFCLLNNAALAAKHAVQCHGAKVLLLDWDVHHGNGTMNLTIDDDKILYMSIHRYDDGTFFPNSKDANYDVVGEGRGEGYNVNIPWNKRGMGDVEYLAAFTQVVLPIAYEYSPDLVIVSAGFDACVGDPLGGCKVSPECYGRMTHLLRGLAGGKVILCLEGGYNITSISYAMTMCTKALLGDPLPHHYEPKTTIHWSAVESINNVIRVHKKYWKSLAFQLALPVEDVLGPPLPSRGLNMTEGDLEKNNKSDSSISTFDDSGAKSSDDLNASLETQMQYLSIKTKCEDGIHCGTDDEAENNATGSKSNKTQPIASTTDNKTQATTSAANKTPEKAKRDIEKTDLDEKVDCKKTCKEKDGPSTIKDRTQNATLVDYLADNMQAIVDGEMFAVIPMPWCPHLESLFAIPNDVKFEQGVKCIDCDHTDENWVCLHCYVTACGRSINGHMQAHYRSTDHPLVLSLSDLSVWCNACDAYVDNALLYDAKNNAHKCKFNEDMPWCYRSDTLHLQ